MIKILSIRVGMNSVVTSPDYKTPFLFSAAFVSSLFIWIGAGHFAPCSLASELIAQRGFLPGSLDRKSRARAYKELRQELRLIKVVLSRRSDGLCYQGEACLSRVS